MNIYDVFRNIVFQTKWQNETQLQEATNIINRAQELALFGNIADTDLTPQPSIKELIDNEQRKNVR